MSSDKSIIQHVRVDVMWIVQWWISFKWFRVAKSLKCMAYCLVIYTLMSDVDAVQDSGAGAIICRHSHGDEEWCSAISWFYGLISIVWVLSGQSVKLLIKWEIYHSNSDGYRWLYLHQTKHNITWRLHVLRCTLWHILSICLGLGRLLITIHNATHER